MPDLDPVYNGERRHECMHILSPHKIIVGVDAATMDITAPQPVLVADLLNMMRISGTQ